MLFGLHLVCLAVPQVLSVPQFCLGPKSTSAPYDRQQPFYVHRISVLAYTQQLKRTVAKWSKSNTDDASFVLKDSVAAEAYVRGFAT